MTKTIVIVGASRGIGKELVLKLACNSENQIYALSRNETAMADFDDLSNVTSCSFDLEGSVNDQLSEILEDLKQVDVLVNNAGKLVNKPLLQLDEDDLLSSYQVNVIGVIQTVQAIVPKMVESGGHIINISSIGGFQGSVKFPGLTAYSTSKAALCSFTELFAEEYKESKVKMNCLCLGAVQTEMLEDAFPGYEAPLSAKEMANYIADFSLSGHQYFNGKIIPVSLSTP